jgi:low temperature requirement protein LtrA
MDLIQIIVILLVVGVLLWAVNAMPAIDPTMKQIIRIVVVVVAVLWLLGMFFPGLHNYRWR